MNKENILFCGKDPRMKWAREFFRQSGHICRFYGEKGENAIPEDCSAVILSLPSFTPDGKVNRSGALSSKELFSPLKAGTKIFGGMFSDGIIRECLEYNLIACDYGGLEDFALLNALPTAEAAVEIALSRLERTLFGARALVIGYGRIGKLLSRRLLSFGADVTVFARRIEILTEAQLDGCTAINTEQGLKKSISHDICFNTVPAKIIGKASVENSSCEHFIELASLPGGFTEEAIKILGEKYLIARGLPGKYFPRTAGEIIYKTVSKMLSES